jgi:pyruvate dehydrogenase E1 component alpha subunit
MMLRSLRACRKASSVLSSSSSSSVSSLSSSLPVGGLSHTQSSRLFASQAADEHTWDAVRDFKGHKLESLPSNLLTTTKEEALEFYQQMVYYRRFEVVADTAYKAKLIRGFCHLYDGQEAIVMGMEAALHGKQDSVISAYRTHPHSIMRGNSGDTVMAELMGRATGCSGGKGGSMHMFSDSDNFYGGNGIVGAQVPLGGGLALAHKMRQDGGVCVAAYGDGAANQGQIMETANMAQLWKLPLIFLCENNTYGMGTSQERASASFEFYTRGDYVPGLWIDGMDVLACKAGFAAARDHAVNVGPIFVECNTYRYHGHSMSDPGISYRTKDEVTSVRKNRDCIEQLKARILEAGWATEKELKDVDKAQRKIVDSHLQFAKDAAEPAVSETYTNIYVEDNTPPRKVRAALDNLL